MSGSTGRSGPMGCATCCPPDPAAAWEARGALARTAELLDESHLHIQLLRCTACGQEFASIFSESVDWAEGDDPQYWCLTPLLRDESAALAAAPEDGLVGALATAAAGRQVLHRDAPKGGPLRVFWSQGLRVLA